MSQPNSQPDPAAAADVTALPRTPRAVSKVIRSLVNREPKVRFWWILTGLMLLASIGFATNGVLRWREDAAVIGNGAVIKAIAWMPGQARIKGRPLEIGQGTSVEIEYEYEGKQYKSVGPLFQTGDEYLTGVPFDIRIDRDNPEVWTNRKRPIPFWENMIGAFIGMTATLGCMATALLIRTRYTRLWISGEQRAARVVDHRQTAMAPRSISLVCAVRLMKEERLVTVFVPQSGVVPEIGRNIDLIVNDSITMALVASKFNP